MRLLWTDVDVFLTPTEKIRPLRRMTAGWNGEEFVSKRLKATMSLRAVVATPFQSRGRAALEESAFIVSLSLDRDWFSPDQASRVVDKALGEGLLERKDGSLQVSFDPDTVEIPSNFSPEQELLRETTPFESVLDSLMSTGMDKQAAVAGINQLQADLSITIEAAAVVFARSNDISVDTPAERAQAKLIRDGDG